MLYSFTAQGEGTWQGNSKIERKWGGEECSGYRVKNTSWESSPVLRHSTLQQDHVELFAISFENLTIQTVKDKYKHGVSCVLAVLCASDLFGLRVYINS